jgi:hypothetical protein
MPKQNRVTPSGGIIVSSARGNFMGNRGGKIDNKDGNIIKNFSKSQWISCSLLHFPKKAKSNKPETPVKYTKLFFLDEVTALSAGHRPCGQCRRSDFNEFVRLWLESNKKELTEIKEIDAILHQERIQDTGDKKTFNANINKLPDFTFIQLREKYYTIYRENLLEWSPSQYLRKIDKPENTQVEVLTPQSIVNTLALGYIPKIHHSAIMLFPDHGLNMEAGQPNVEEYKTAILVILKEDHKNWVKMLKAHYFAENNTITATALAEAAGYKNYVGVNSQYGNLAYKLCELLKYEPSERNKENKPIWTFALATGEQKDEWEWTLRPQVQKALEELAW